MNELMNENKKLIKKLLGTKRGEKLGNFRDAQVSDKKECVFLFSMSHNSKSGYIL